MGAPASGCGRPTPAASICVRSAGPERGDAPMRSLPRGWFELTVPHADASTRYAFRIDGDLVVPDPASRCNPDDVHAASALVDPLAFRLARRRMARAPVARGGDLRAARRLLHARGHLPRRHRAARRTGGAGRHRDRADAGGRFRRPARLGLRRRAAVRARCVVRHAGRPEAPGRGRARARADGAARRGLQPLRPRRQLPAPLRAARSSTPDVHTPWGAAINFDGAHSATVREFFIHNALYWIEEFRFDGLRLDAVHAMHDRSRRFIADAIAHALHSGPGRDRHVHLVLENERNDAARLVRLARGGPHLADRAMERRRAPRAARDGDRRARRLLRRLRRRSAAPVRRARWPKASPSRASLRRCATARRAARRRPTCRRWRSSIRRRRTTRSATARTASASPSWPNGTPRARRCARWWPACCCRRRCRCCSWARSSRPARRSCTSAISRASLRAR